MANSCTKADVDFYLQRSFTNEQIVRLCTSAPTQITNQLPAQAQYQTQYAPPVDRQSQAIREDQIYLSTALDAKDVNLNSSGLSYISKECAVYSAFPNNNDLDENLCIDAKVAIDFSGLQIKKISKGIFLVKDPELIVSGNIKRDYLNLNSIRRQDRGPIQQILPTTPKEININVRNGIDPKQVADLIKKYIR
jgi:hypothetical protein